MAKKNSNNKHIRTMVESLIKGDSDAAGTALHSYLRSKTNKLILGEADKEDECDDCGKSPCACDDESKDDKKDKKSDKKDKKSDKKDKKSDKEDKDKDDKKDDESDDDKKPEKGKKGVNPFAKKDDKDSDDE